MEIEMVVAVAVFHCPTKRADCDQVADAATVIVAPGRCRRGTLAWLIRSRSERDRTVVGFGTRLGSYTFVGQDVDDRRGYRCVARALQSMEFRMVFLHSITKQAQNTTDLN